MSDTNLPVRAVGWRLLIEPVAVKKQSDGGIILAAESVKAQEYLRYVGKVVDAGGLAYQDSKFGGTPWCAVGDHVAYAKYAGQEVIVNPDTADGEPKRYRLINDDEVLAVIPDPSAIMIPI